MDLKVAAVYVTLMFMSGKSHDLLCLLCRRDEVNV